MTLRFLQLIPSASEDKFHQALKFMQICQTFFLFIIYINFVSYLVSGWFVFFKSQNGSSVVRLVAYEILGFQEEDGYALVKND